MTCCVTSCLQITWRPIQGGSDDTPLVVVEDFGVCRQNLERVGCGNFIVAVIIVVVLTVMYLYSWFLDKSLGKDSSALFLDSKGLGRKWVSWQNGGSRWLHCVLDDTSLVALRRKDWLSIRWIYWQTCSWCDCCWFGWRLGWLGCALRWLSSRWNSRKLGFLAQE